jgi:glutathione S-transferase
VAINPRHQVPTIVDDGYALWESLAILEYLDERIPGAPRRLYPGTAQQRARIRRLVREDEEHLDRKGLTPVYEEFYNRPEGTPPDEARVAEGRRKLSEELDYFGAELRGSFLAGDEPTAADFVLYPDIAYVKRIAAKKPASGLAGILPAPIAAWAARIEALPYFEKTFPPHWRS